MNGPWWFVGVVIFLAGVGILEYTVLVGAMVMIAGVAVILLYLSMRTKYPVRALIFQKRHGNVRMVWDMATRIEIEKGSGTFKYKFKKLKDETKAARYENLYPSGKGEIALFFSPAPGEYYQAIFKEATKKRTKEIEYTDAEGNTKTKKVEVEEPEITPIPDDLMEWMILKQQRAKQRYDQKSAWDKYYPFVVAAVMMMMLGIVIAVLFNSMTPVTESWERAGNSFQDGASKIAAAIEKLDQMQNGEQVVSNNQPTQGDLPAPPDVS